MSWEEKIMKSKTSYFNKAVLKDMTQFWSLWAVEIVISLLIFIMPLMSSVNGIIREYTGNTLNARSDIKESLISFTAVLANPVFLFVMAIVVAVVVFQYTFNSREMYMIHSLPVKGNIIYITLYCRSCYASDTVCDRICRIYYSWKDVLCRAYDKSAASGI